MNKAAFLAAAVLLAGYHAPALAQAKPAAPNMAAEAPAPQAPAKKP